MSALRYLSVCSGISADTVAWSPLGWEAAAFAEIEPAPRAVLAHHWPEVPIHGDFTTIRAGQYGPVQLLVGGTPCQPFSVAGLRGGLADDRGNLALEFLRLAHRLRPEWLVWENVPGVLSSNRGRDFGAILGGMVELGYGFAYRVLDAQYVRVDGFGRAVPQRRRRVIVVGHLGDWRRAAAVLFERASLCGDPPPRREAGARIAGSLTAGSGGGCGPDDNDARAGRLIAAPFAPAISASNPYGDHESREGLLVAHTLRGEGFDASEDGTARGTPIVPVAYGGNDTRGPIRVATAVNAHGGPHGRLDFESETFIAFQQGGSNVGTTGAVTNTLTKGNGNESGGVPCIAFDTTQITSAANRRSPQPGDPCHPLAAGAHPPAIAFNSRQDPDVTWDRAGALSSSSPQAEAVAMMGHNRGPAMWAVRRLTPLECERLQGFPDGHTAVPWRGGIMPDGPRYKMLGNSFAVNVVRWIGRRIEAVENGSSSQAAA